MISGVCKLVNPDRQYGQLSHVSMMQANGYIALIEAFYKSIFIQELKFIILIVYQERLFGCVCNARFLTIRFLNDYHSISNARYLAQTPCVLIPSVHIVLETSNTMFASNMDANRIESPK